MSPSQIERDERTVTVENASYRWAYLVLSFGILVDMMYRSGWLHQFCWDLFALVVVSGAVGRVYQVRQNALAHGWVMKAVLVMIVAACAGVVVALLLR